MDSGTDSEDDKLSSNLSMDYKDYFMCDPKPRWCSYCGIHNIFNGLLQCTIPECGRQTCKLCLMS